MKAILVIDLDDENISHYGVCVYHYTSRQFVHIDAPLKPMPKEEDIYEVGIDEEDTRAKQQWNKGWNACLEEIEK